jgi:hypothetical protein
VAKERREEKEERALGGRARHYREVGRKRI